ncbi:S-layer homology domain-containing protein [Bacillus mycoides]|uniref:S-layer homology domain-containing protein n=1 Tax=Bacillus mycoides TaxID=1405 RepID=UPI003CFFDA98
MKKMPVFLASCVLSTGVLLNSPIISKAEEASKQITVSKEEASKQITVSKEEARKKAELYVIGVSKQQFKGWKDANINEGNTLYDLRGYISGYVFQVKKDNQDMGYIIVGSKKSKNSIVESTREGTSPYKDVEEGNAIYTGPLQHYKKDTNKVTDLHTNQSSELKDVKQPEEKKRSIAAPFANSSSNDEEDFGFKQKYISNVPDYNWYRGCSPTAIGNVVAYWGQNGYSNLISNKAEKQVIDKLADAMGTTPAKRTPVLKGSQIVSYIVEGGGTYTTAMAPGIKKYFNDVGYNPEVSLDETPTYEEYTKEIDAGRPIVINTQNHILYDNHTVTGVGYQQIYIPELNEDYTDLTIHDTWNITPVDVTLSYNQYKESIESYVLLTPLKFQDVPRSHWAYSEIAYMAQQKIMNGYGNEYFGPADNVTREQLAAFLYRILKPADSNENPYTDIKGNSFEKEITTLTKMGIFSVNQERKFNPKNTATRAEIATVLTKAFNLKAKANYEFNDMKGHWANEYVKALYTNGIANGTGNKNFSPDAKVTREQMAMFLYRAINLDPDFKPSPIK